MSDTGEIGNNIPAEVLIMIASAKDKANETLLLQDILSHFRLDNPKMRSIIKQEIAKNQITKETIRRLKIQNSKLQEQVTSLKNQLKEIRTDKSEIANRLNNILKLNKFLSDALGSCTSCWGEDPNCINCWGTGFPGWRNINRRLFNIYVLPALEKIYGSATGTRKGKVVKISE